MANISYAHGGDHAVVSLTDELDWDACRELVELIDLLVHEYFYTTVELVVTSKGGRVSAFEYFLGRFEEWRRQGVTLRTRVLSEASSAAAVLVALGDERVAEPGATLGFHGTQVSPESGVNAATTATMSSLLHEADETFIGRLVTRALEAEAKVPHEAVRADVRVLQQLWTEFRRPRNNGRPPCQPRKLARAVGRYVDRALERRDRHALASVYRRLVEVECTLSAPLACSLRLIDRVGARAPRGSQVAGTPGLTVPEWRGLYPPDGWVPREALCRHALVLGETGSGKTASVILPVVAAMARAQEGTLAAGLVIDPKRELAPALETLAPERVHRLRPDRVMLDIMSGPRWSIEEELAARRWVSAARKVLCRVASFVPTNPARVLLDHAVGDSNTEFFNREGTALAISVLAFLLMVIDSRTPPHEQWLGEGDDAEAYVWVDDLLERARSERGPNAVALAAWCLDGPLMAAPPPERSVLATSTDGSFQPASRAPRWLFARLARTAAQCLCAESAEGRDLCERIVGYWASMVEIDKQFAGVRATASVVCSDFASPAIASSLYVGCEPGYQARGAGADGVDFARLVAPDGPGKLVVVQPARDGLDNLFAIALKARFFEAVLDDPARATGANDLPMVAYVADEFHRFVTADPVHGEQSFLDSCRSYGAFCMLACQSVASIQHALAHGGGSAEQNRSSVEILLSNTGTKVWFRSTDPGTLARVAELSPSRPGLASVTQVRPVSSLGVGEAYVALPDGRFERRQLGRFHAGEAPLGRSVAAGGRGAV